MQSKTKINFKIKKFNGKMNIVNIETNKLAKILLTVY